MRIGDIFGVIPAAGLSSRTGNFKPALLIRGKPLIACAIESMVAWCREIIVVGGYNIETIRELTRHYANVRVVCNPHYATGMFGSVKVGIRQGTGQWFFLVPGDCPSIDPAVYETLLDSRDRDPTQTIFIPVKDGRHGHPVLMHRRHIPDILREPEESNLKLFINRHNFFSVEVNDPGILFDVDTMADYEFAVK
ncbi:MAG: nucleotidyltransferase family protein [Candidatus Omnitrophota bacterium]